YGGEIDTPNINALAAGGVRFSQFYNSARCCPTRATLMTGLHPHQAGIGHMTNAPNERREGPPAYQGYLNRDCVTIAEALRPAGYTTLMAGKWHLGYNARDRWPLQRGFEEYYGCISGATNYFNPRQPRGITFGNEIDDQLKSTTDRRYYTTDAFTDYAIRFVNEAIGEAEKPFFLYLAYTAPHWPLQAHEEELAKYRGKYKLGWDQLREQRYRRQIELGLIPENWALTPRDQRAPAWDTLDPAKQDEMDLRMAIYAAMIDRVDQNIGRFVANLRQKNLLDNTLILFLSDNGACAEGGILGRGPVLDEQQRNASYDASYGLAWANASSTPYRLYKHFTHEGGSCTPFFMHWPERVSPQSAWYRSPAQLIDIMPTILDVAGAEYPREHHGLPIIPLDGISLSPAFTGATLKRDAPIFLEHENNASARDGKWKLVGRGVAGRERVRPRRWELYDMDADGTELHNLAQEKPRVTRRLSQQWNEWAERSKVYPKTLLQASGS
ncbi:MAG: arylsulfatase, partial [Planctomycetales bacterium]|nr:arylsulfatase [Planctomycetales bacterium]